MPGVSIIGSGNVGANTAFFIAEKGTHHVTLYDVREGLSTGKALDMMEAAPVRQYRPKLRGSDSIEAIAGSDVVVLAAGAVRKPGMKREDLFNENLALVREVAPTVARLAPKAIVIIATEPVDPITTLFVRESKMPRNQVIGLGGILDSTRLRYGIAHELRVSMDNVQAMVIGRHSDEMIMLSGYTNVSGIPIEQLLTQEAIEKLVNETRSAGDLIVQMSQRSNAYYAPSAAAAELADAIHTDIHRIFSVSVMLAGEYGIHDVALSLPAIIGREGVVRVMTPKLSREQEQQLSRSAEEVNMLLSGRTR